VENWREGRKAFSLNHAATIMLSFSAKVRHDVVHLFLYMHYLLILDRHDHVPRTDEGDRTEGVREALPGSTG